MEGQKATSHLGRQKIYLCLGEGKNNKNFERKGLGMNSEKRDITKLIRFNEKEYKLVMEKANANNMNFSAYVRFVISNVKATNPELRALLIKLINEVNYIGHNINQVVRNNNSGLYLDSDKSRLMEYMRLLNLKVGALLEQYGY